MNVLLNLKNKEYREQLKQLLSLKCINPIYTETFTLREFELELKNQNKYKIIFSDPHLLNEDNIIVNDSGIKSILHYEKNLIETAIFLIFDNKKELTNHNYLANYTDKEIRCVQVPRRNKDGILSVKSYLISSFNKSKKLHDLLKEKPTLLFVHGFGGSESTWSKLIDVIDDDDDLSGRYNIEHFEYPTPSLSYKLLISTVHPRYYQGISDLANSLKTKIENLIESSESITLIGHSMGGLIIRKCIAENIKKEYIHKISHIIQFATPNGGSGLSNFKYLLLRSKQLKDLAIDSDFIKDLNKTWSEQNLNNIIPNTAFVPQQDIAVNQESSKLLMKTIKHYPNKGHFDIKEPLSKNDSAYKDFKNIINN